MTKRKFFAILVGGFFSTIVMMFPFQTPSFIGFIPLFVILCLWVTVFTALGAKITRDFNLKVSVGYILSFLLSVVCFFLLLSTMLPDGMKENGVVLVRRGSLTFAGLLMALRDSALVSLSVYVYAAVMLVTRRRARHVVDEELR